MAQNPNSFNGPYRPHGQAPPPGLHARPGPQLPPAHPQIPPRTAAPPTSMRTAANYPANYNSRPPPSHMMPPPVTPPSQMIPSQPSAPPSQMPTAQHPQMPSTGPGASMSRPQFVPNTLPAQSQTLWFAYNTVKDELDRAKKYLKQAYYRQQTAPYKQTNFQDFQTFVLFGDSITAECYKPGDAFSFGAQLSDDYQGKLHIQSHGCSGYNTAHALRILPQVLGQSISETSSIKLMTYFFGANDATLPGQLQHIPLSMYTSNLKKMLTHPAHQRHGDLKKILIIPSPICEYLTRESDAALGRSGVYRLADNTRKYAQAAVQVARELNIPFVDLYRVVMEYVTFDPIANRSTWNPTQKETPGAKMTTNYFNQPILMAQNERFKHLLRDGLHFTPQLDKLLYDELVLTITIYYPDLAASNISGVYPWWQEAEREPGCY